MEISQITPRLFISAWPTEGGSVDLLGHGIRLVISMTRVEPLSEYVHEPLLWLHVPTVDSPFTPIPLAQLRRGVETAIPVLAEGGGVLCHCRQGRHRSVAMACSILIAQGCSAKSAMHLVRANRRVADPHAFWIAPRIRAFERKWRTSWSAEFDVPPSVAEESCR